MDFENEYFGTPAHVSLQKRSLDLWRLVRDDPRYGTYGRNVLLVGDQGADMADKMAGIARLTGAAGTHYYPAAKADALCRALAEKGLSAGRWELCTGGQQAYDLSRAILADVALPDDLRVTRLAADSPAELVRAVAELSMDCGVMPVPGRNMRGLANSGLCLAALDRNGVPVATGSSYRYTHPDSLYRDYAFWGALATRPDRRGEKIAVVLGAMAIVDMWENHGVRAFTTGIKADNAASFAVCAKQGVTRSDWTFVACTDPDHFHGASMTR